MHLYPLMNLLTRTHSWDWDWHFQIIWKPLSFSQNLQKSNSHHFKFLWLLICQKLLEMESANLERQTTLSKTKNLLPILNLGNWREVVILRVTSNRWRKIKQSNSNLFNWIIKTNYADTQRVLTITPYYKCKNAL